MPDRDPDPDNLGSLPSSAYREEPGMPDEGLRESRPSGDTPGEPLQQTPYPTFVSERRHIECLLDRLPISISPCLQNCDGTPDRDDRATRSRGNSANR